MGRGELGQPRRWICTNTSYGLSADSWLSCSYLVIRALQSIAHVNQKGTNQDERKNFYFSFLYFSNLLWSTVICHGVLCCVNPSLCHISMFFHMPESAGFKIQAVTTDMGPANTAVWNHTGIESTHRKLTAAELHPSVADSTLYMYFITDRPCLLDKICGTVCWPTRSL